MKKLILLAVVLFSAATMLAQTNRMSYQAVVRNAANELVAEENLTVAIRISDASSTSVFSETHSVTSNRNGVISLMIGEGSGQSGSMASVDWRTAQIHTEVTLPGGATLTNTTPVNAVPYAFYADSVDIHWVNDAVDDYLEHHSIGSIVETDPTVPAWAKEATKPAYDYSEITGTPAIPTVNDGTLTIQKNGETVGTFTANQAGNTTVNITITAQDILDAVNGMTDAEKAALCSALNCGGTVDPASFTCGTSKMVDADGNEYETVLIGTQCWTKTNLRSTKAADGSAIPAGGSATSITDPYYYDYSSHSLPLATRGYLYNWPAANLVCPAGWHLPSDAEWTVMEQTQTSMDVTGSGWRGDHAGKLAGEGWEPSTTAGTPGNASDPDHNATGFSAVPAGGCYGSSFYDAGYLASFWSSTQNYSVSAYGRYLGYDYASVYRSNGSQNYGCSVRCLRDETGGGTALTEPTVTTSGATDVTETSATLNGSVSNPDGVTITAQGFEWKATTGGTYAQVTATGSTMSYALTGLTAGTSYTYRAFVTTAAGTSYGDEVVFTTTSSAPTVFTCGTSKMVDADGNEYETVLIGTQCWTKTNLRVAPAGATDGTTTTSGPYSSYTEPYYYDYSSHSLPLATRGYLYNWPAANLVCPAGWHLPSNAEWTALTDYVSSQSEYTCGGNSSYIAKALASTEGWNSSTGICVVGNGPSTNNATGFSAVPTGYCRGLSYYDAGDQAYFWCATLGSSDPSLAYYRSLAFANARMLMFQDYHKDNGYSVRCLRD